MSNVEIAVTRLPHNADLPLPAYETAQSAGMDLAAAIDGPVTLAPGARDMIPTGLAIALPAGYGNPGPAAVRTSRKERCDGPQYARHRGCRLSRRSEGHPDQPRRRGFCDRTRHADRANGDRPGNQAVFSKSSLFRKQTGAPADSVRPEPEWQARWIFPKIRYSVTPGISSCPKSAVPGSRNCWKPGSW